MKNAFIALGLSLGLLVFGCKKDDAGSNTAGNITASGSVQNFGGSALAGAVVQFFQGSTASGTPVATATSNASGQWQLTLSSAGMYTCVVSAAGRPTAFIMVVIQTGQTSVSVETAVLASQSTTGTVNDAQTGQVIAGAIVRFFSGSNSDTSGYRFSDLITDSQGRFNTVLTLGRYVYVIHAAGRVPLVANRNVTDTVATQYTTTVTQPVPVGRMRIVLNWGLKPSDLDSHLTGDSTAVAGKPRYHISYQNYSVRAANGDTIAFLDHDDVTSYGPETITIFKFFPGTLRYKIHDYSNRSVTGSHFMSDSSAAVVRVYTSAGLIREDHILTGTAGNQWYAYDINGSTQTVTFVNTIRDGVSNPADSSFRPVALPPKSVAGK